MAEVWFYHLTLSPLELTLPILLGKSLERGLRVVVRGADPLRLAWLDERLWLGPKEGFLPHGLVGGPFDADQPVLLMSGPGRPNAADYLVAVDGAGIGGDDFAAFARVSVLFDGNDAAALEVARAQWRGVTAAGARAIYWTEADGRWQKRHESGGA